MKISLLTGGGDKPYALGLLDALISKDITVDFIGSDDLSTADSMADQRVNFLNLRGDQNSAVPVVRKIIRVSRYYLRLLLYAARTDSIVFHILWANRFVLLNRVLLNVYYKLLGKKLVFTAHNVNEKERDGGDSFFNRLTLRALYGLVDHIFVHTNKMKTQLIEEFNLTEAKISVIPFGINNTLPKSNLNKLKARTILQLGNEEKVLLFFGNIASYKGLEFAIDALDRLRKSDDSFRLIIAGQIKGSQIYWNDIERLIEDLDLSKHVIKRIEYIPDKDVEIFFKSSDVLILPYKFIYQSGVLFLSYSFGLPVIATDVGSLREDILEGKTGMLSRAEDADDLADTIGRYFKSELFRNLEQSRKEIIEYGNKKYSWEEVSDITRAVYTKLLCERRMDRVIN